MKKLLLPFSLMLLMLLPSFFAKSPGSIAIAASAAAIPDRHDDCMSYSLQMFDWCLAGTEGSEYDVIVCAQFSAQIYHNCMELPN